MKKFMALLATGLVMALSATSVLAAGSVSLETVKPVCQDTLNEDGNIYVAGNSAATDAEATVVDKSSEVNTSVAGDAVAQYEASSKSTLEGVAVAAYADIVVTLKDANGTEIAVSEENPAFLSVAAMAPSAVGKNVVVLNYQNGAWVEVELVEIDGTTFAKFTHFSPVMVLTYEKATVEAPQGHWYYDPAIDGPVDPSLPGAATSPKTGVLPVAAFAATICLAGAAVCGKKVK